MQVVMAHHAAGGVGTGKPNPGALPDEDISFRVRARRGCIVTSNNPLEGRQRKATLTR